MTTDDIESSRAAHRDMFAALKARRDLLEEAVRKKTEELKAICLQEGVSLGDIIGGKCLHLTLVSENPIQCRFFNCIRCVCVIH